MSFNSQHGSLSDRNHDSGPIYATIDTGSQTNLIKDIHIKHPCFTNARPPTRDITVTGISSSVKFVGQHQYLGDVLFENFSSNLIGAPQLISHNLIHSPCLF